MESNQRRIQLQTNQNNLSDPREKARLLRRVGIFPDNIVEFGKLVVPRLKLKKNYSK